MARNNKNTTQSEPSQFDELELLEMSHAQIELPKDDEVAAQLPIENLAKARSSGLSTPLLLLLLGGIAGVFGSPYLVPFLPESIGKYLTPIDAQREVNPEIVSQIDALAVRIDGVEGFINDNKVPNDLTKIEAQIADLTSKLAAKPIPSSNSVSGDTSALQAEIETLKTQTAGLTKALNATLSATAVEAETSVVNAQAETKRVAAKLAIANLKTSLAEGKDISNDLRALQDAGIKAPPILQEFKGELTSLTALEDGFGAYAIEAIRASIMATSGENNGIVNEISTQLSAQLAGRSTSPQEGMTPDAILSRSEDHLKKGNLEQALAEIAALPSEALEAMKPWVDQARNTLNVSAAVNAIDPIGSGN